MDESTVNQLIASNFRNPVVTDIIFDPHLMYEIVRRGLPFTEKGHNTVWDTAIFESAWKYFQDGFKVVEKQIEDEQIELNLIVEATPDNVERLSSLPYPDLRHVDNLRGNMGIADKQVYVVNIFHQGSDLPDQTFFSNNSN